MIKPSFALCLQISLILTTAWPSELHAVFLNPLCTLCAANTYIGPLAGIWTVSQVQDLQKMKKNGQFSSSGSQPLFSFSLELLNPQLSLLKPELSIHHDQLNISFQWNEQSFQLLKIEHSCFPEPAPASSCVKCCPSLQIKSCFHDKLDSCWSVTRLSRYSSLC